MFIFILASDRTSKKIIIIKTKTKTLFILMKSSYPTYHNNKIEESMMQEYDTHTHTHKHMYIWIFFYLHWSSLLWRHQPLVVIWQYQHYHSWQPIWALCNYPDENIIIKDNSILSMIIKSTLRNITLWCTNIILSHTLSNYTINHIKWSNITKWLRVIKTKRENKSKRLKEWKK